MKPSKNVFIAPAIIAYLPGGRHCIAIPTFDGWRTLIDGKPLADEVAQDLGDLLNNSSYSRVYAAMQGRRVAAIGDGDDIVIYSSIAASARDGYSASCIRQCLSGKRLSHRGKRWEEVRNG